MQDGWGWLKVVTLLMQLLWLCSWRRYMHMVWQRPS